MPRYASAASLILTLALAAAWPYRLLGQGSERDLSMSNKLVIRIGDKTFAATVEDNATAAAFRKLLPLSVTMRDLNANEKLYRLPSAIPTNPSTPQSIQTGDLLLYGSNTVVLFYKSFPTTYSYTRIGRVDDPTGLEAAVGSGDVAVTFEARREKP